MEYKKLFIVSAILCLLSMSIVSCNDGLRPVIMKLEATDIESKSDK